MQHTDSNCTTWVFLSGVHHWSAKLKKGLDYKPSKVSEAAYKNVPLRDIEFVWESKRDIMKAVEELSAYESLR